MLLRRPRRDRKRHRTRTAMFHRLRPRIRRSDGSSSPVGLSEHPIVVATALATLLARTVTVLPGSALAAVWPQVAAQVGHLRRTQ